jgi:DNA polymerase-1
MLFNPEDINKLKVPYTFIEKDDAQATEVLESLRKCYLLGVDLETNGVDPHNNDVLLMQISTGTQNYVFDVHHKDMYPEGSPNYVLLKEILTNPNIIKIAHNALFEFKMLYSRFNFKSRPWFDTMLAELILYPRENKENKKFNLPSLGFVCDKYLGFGLDKSVRAEFHSGYTFTGFTEQQLQYAANDSAVLLPLYNILIKMLQENDLMRVLELETKVLEVTAVMEYLGVKLDIEKWKSDLNELEEEYKNLKSDILDLLAEGSTKRSIWGKPMVNLNSPTQLLKALNKLGLDITATNTKELKRVKRSAPYDVISFFFLL